MINTLFKNLKRDFKIIKAINRKPTARCPFSYIVETNNEKKLVIIAKTDIQKFYLKRAIEKQKEFFEDFSPYFKFNFPDEYGDMENFSYVIYPYLENLKWLIDNRPLEILNKIYSEKAVRYKMTDELLEKIKEDFLAAWPDKYHTKIQKSDLFLQYFNSIKKLEEVTIYKEHGDYAINNILTDEKDLYLIDFEFAKSFQVIGHDEHQYKRTQALEYLSRDSLEKIKEKLTDEVNDFADRNRRHYLCKFFKLIKPMLLNIKK